MGYQEVGGVYDYLKRMEGGNSERDQQRHNPGKRGDRGGHHFGGNLGVCDPE